MNHPSEQDLVLHFYGEARDKAALEHHLAECRACSSEFSRLRTTLTSIELSVPEQPADYEAQLWSTLRPRLEQTQAPRRSMWSEILQPRRWAVAGAVALIVLAAFLAGRMTGKKNTVPVLTAVSTPQPSGSSDRVLMVAVGDHLDRTEMILVELTHTRAEGKINISAERDIAQSLVNENRLYRQTAQHSKDPEIASVLDEVERVLMDIAHRPDSVSAKELETLQKQIESQGVLFKMRVVESRVKARSRAETQAAAQPSPSSTL